jgi:Methyltransferase domain
MSTATASAPAPAAAAKKNPYWEARKSSIYLYVAKAICQKYGGHPTSVIDIGSNGTPTLEWHRKWATRLVSLDLRNPYEAPGVESMTKNFFEYYPTERFDLVTCFQVLEHVPDPTLFAQKLLDIGKVAIVSVPYKWREGGCKYHIHDPVDEVKMRQWFGREPAFSYVAKELNKVERLIHVYRNGEG